MAQTPLSNSTLLNNAAKDDLLGNDGVFSFTYDQLVAKLLANDPGGAAKLAGHFFFGDDATDSHSIDAQTAYLATHDINLGEDGLYHIGANATDISYFVQIGNKGTWSEANVDVTQNPGHLGDALFTENFDSYSGTPLNNPVGGTMVNLVTDLASQGWTNTGGHTELGVSGYGDSANGGLTATTGGFWLDTQNSPNGIDVSHTFNDTTAPIAGAVRNAVGIRCGAFSGNMKVSFQAARSIG
jgi:hypothetical protein